MRDLLAGFGYAEAIHYAFQRPRRATSAFPRWSRDGEPLALANPLSERYAVLRRSLVPNLVAAAEFNANRGARGVRLFEVGHLFPGGGRTEVEARRLGRRRRRRRRPGIAAPSSTCSRSRGSVEALLAELGVDGARSRPAELPGVAPGTGAAWRARRRTTVGWFGRLGAADDAPFRSSPASCCSTACRSRAARAAGSQPPSRLPGIDGRPHPDPPARACRGRELAAAIARPRVEPILAGFRLKDRYQGAGVPAGAVATTITFDYHAGERSLTQDEVNAAAPGARGRSRAPVRRRPRGPAAEEKR